MKQDKALKKSLQNQYIALNVRLRECRFRYRTIWHISWLNKIIESVIQ